VRRITETRFEAFLSLFRSKNVLWKKYFRDLGCSIMSSGLVGRGEAGTPLVTILTPTYNQAQYIEETIASIRAQTYPFIEYIIIDDGSTDSTPGLLEKYSKSYTCLRQENVGQAETINRGLDLAKGKYFGYLSSDDLLAPEAVATLVRVLEASPDLACVFPDANLIDAGSRVVKRNVCRAFDYAQLLVRQECYIGPGALFRTDLARQIGGWRLDLKLAPDREFWLRLCKLGEIQFVDQVLAGYRLHGKSISYSGVSESVSREYLNVLDAHFSNMSKEEPMLARRDEAYGFANFLIARNCIREGSFSRAWAYYRDAIALYRPLNKPFAWFSLLRTSISKPIRIVLHNISSGFRNLKAQR
jgi:glycosyltransferase involved in cell wall biosynthesis